MPSLHFGPSPLQSPIPQSQRLQPLSPLPLGLPHVSTALGSVRPFHSTQTRVYLCCACKAIKPVTIDELPPNALRHKRDPDSLDGFSLGIDLGNSRTGVALSKGFSFRPLTVLELQGQKLEAELLEIAEDEEADEFIIGIPKSLDGNETPQSNIVRDFAGRLAVCAAKRGWRVYLVDEHGTTAYASNHMINMGLGKSTRKKKLDSYAAAMLLQRYFSMSGQGAELVVPENLELHEKLRMGPPEDDEDLFSEEFED